MLIKTGFYTLLGLVAVVALLVPVLSPGPTPWLPRAEAQVSANAEHDLYNPARTALVNARRQLAETFRQEQSIIRQRQAVRRELDESLLLLTRAEKIDPAMTKPIEELRDKIARLEADPCANEYESDSLKVLYDQLLNEFEKLIAHY